MFFGLFLETGILGIVRLAILVRVEVNESIGSREVSKRSVSSDWHLLKRVAQSALFNFQFSRILKGDCSLEMIIGK